MPKPTTPDDRFDRLDETLERVLFHLQNHSQQLTELQAGQAEIRADIHRIRVSVDTLLRGST